VFPRDMVCLRNISVDTLCKGDTEDDDDNDNNDDDDDNNNNNNNNNRSALLFKENIWTEVSDRKTLLERTAS
jgi:hypothetical protein